MEALLNTVNKKIYFVVKYILIFLSAEIVLLIGINVTLRYFFHMPLYWVEELTKYSFLWGTFLGTAICFQQRGLIAVTIIVSKLKRTVRRYIHILIELMITFCLIVFFIYGIMMTLIAAAQISPILHIPMSFVYATVPVSSLIMLIANAGNIVCQIHSKEPLGNWGEG